MANEAKRHDAAQRKQAMRELAAMARTEDERGDVVAREKWSNQWFELATDAEAKRAPAYLRWYGR